MDMQDFEHVQESNNEPHGKIRVQPLTLTIKDVIWILTAVVSIVVAWGLYGSRISVLEVNQITANNELKELKDNVSKLKDKNIKQDKEILELQLKNHINPRD